MSDDQAAAIPGGSARAGGEAAFASGVAGAPGIADPAVDPAADPEATTPEPGRHALTGTWRWSWPG